MADLIDAVIINLYVESGSDVYETHSSIDVEMNKK